MEWCAVRAMATMALACLLMPALASAAGHPRTPPKPPESMSEQPSLAEWLPRLAGRYALEGVVDPESGQDAQGVKGTADCVLVGEGPGVQCILDARWTQRWSRLGQPVGTPPYLHPAMLLLGVTTGEKAVRYLQVDYKGIAQGGNGLLGGSMIRLASDPTFNGIYTIIRAYAPRHGRFVQIWCSIHTPQSGESPHFLMLQLRRMTQRSSQ